MDFSTLQTEFFAHGFEDWDDAGEGLARAKRLLNEAHKVICSDQPWPFLNASASGAAPLTISDLRFVRLVTNTSEERPLLFIEPEQVRYWYPDLTETGTPIWWYPSSTTEISVYPANTSDTIRVDYVKHPATLLSDGDTPDMPGFFHLLVVQGAVLRAQTYKDQATADSAAVLRAEYNRGLEEMRQALLIGQAEGNQLHVQTGWYDGGVL